MLADPQAPDVIAGAAVLAAPVTGVEVQPAEEQGPLRQLTQRLRLAAELVPEHFRVGAGGGDVLAGDDVLPGAVDHRGEGGAAGVVMGAFAVEGITER